jgi:hypothetical protein
MIKIEKGMKFRFKSKYDDSYYFGIVDTVLHTVSNKDYVYFYAENGVAYNSNEVEWIDELRDQKLKELGL